MNKHFVACAALALVLVGRTAQAEAIRFAAAPVNPTPFAVRQAELHGTKAAPTPGDMIAGEIYKPEGPGPFPAVVFLHGCLGWPRSADARRTQAEKYTAQGFVFLEVDSFGPRGIRQDCVPTPGNPPADRLGDAQGALDWLSTQAFVDPIRVALMGNSQGGSVVLNTLSLERWASPGHHHFAAGIALYPSCSPMAAIVSAPLLVIVGALDDWTPAAACRAMGALPHDGGSPETVMILAGAKHSFDAESLSDKPRNLFGHHEEFNLEAAQTASAAVSRFLTVTLRPLK